MTSPYKTLIIGPSWVGDMVMAQSLFMMLKKQGGRQIDVLAPSWSRPILERMPEVTTAIDMPLGHGKVAISDRKAIGRSLTKQNYQQAIVLPNSWKSALIPWFANIPKRTGWLGEARYFLLNDARTLNKQALPLMVQRFVALAHPNSQKVIPLTECPTPLLSISQEKQAQALNKLNLHIEKPVLALCPGAEFGPAKQWPSEHYAEVALIALKKGQQVWIMGSAADKATGDMIIKRAGGHTSIANLCGQTSLEEAIDLLSLATQVISNDSGLMHVASALKKPLIALYGATSPAFTPPLSASAQVLSIPVDCGPCFKRECPLGHHQCMQDLTPDKVIRALKYDTHIYTPTPWTPKP